MDTSFSEAFSGDDLADKNAERASEPSTPAEQAQGSQPATGRQPQNPAGMGGRAPVLPFSQVRPGLDSPRPTEGLGEEPGTGFDPNATDALGQPAFGLTGLPATAESAQARAARVRLESMSRFWVENPAWKHRGKMSFFLAKPYGPRLKSRLR